MTSDQNNKLAMYGSVEELLKTTTETSGIAGLPAKLTTLTTKLAELRTLAGTQTQPTAGQTASRDQTLANLIDTALEIAGVLGAYAHEHTLRDLSALVDVQRSDFDAVRLIQRPLLAQRVHDAAAGALPQLAGLNLTAETLVAFQAQIDAARGKLNQPRMTVVAKKAATEQLAAAFAAIDGLLAEQIDRLLLPLRKTSPAFYAQYRAARSIVNVPGVRSNLAPTPVTPTASVVPAVVSASAVPVSAIVTAADIAVEPKAA